MMHQLAFSEDFCKAFGARPVKVFVVLDPESSRAPSCFACLLRLLL